MILNTYLVYLAPLLLSTLRINMEPVNLIAKIYHVYTKEWGILWTYLWPYIMHLTPSYRTVSKKLDNLKVWLRIAICWADFRCMLIINDI